MRSSRLAPCLLAVLLLLLATQATAQQAVTLIPDAVLFRALAGGSAPIPQTVTVSPRREGVLDGLWLSTSYEPGASNWLQTSLSSTTTLATVTLAVTLGTLTVGEYQAHVFVMRSKQEYIDTIYVRMQVEPWPVLAVEPQEVTFEAWYGGLVPGAREVQLTNTGGGTIADLSLGTISYPWQSDGASPWLQAQLRGTMAPATLTVAVTTSTLRPGRYQAQVPVLSSATTASGKPAYVEVRYEVKTPPAIALTPADVSFTAAVLGQTPATREVRVNNAGDGALGGLSLGAISYGPGESEWLHAELSATTVPANLRLSVAPGALVPGEYTALIPVTSSQEGISPQTVTVTLRVDPPALLALQPPEIRFSAVEGGSVPDDMVSLVTNAGGGTLSIVAVGTTSYGPGASNWLQARVLQSPLRLSIAVTPGTMAVGEYTARVPVVSQEAGNSPQEAIVRLQVTRPAAVSVTQDSAGVRTPRRATRDYAYTEASTLVSAQEVLGHASPTSGGPPRFELFSQGDRTSVVWKNARGGERSPDSQENWVRVPVDLPDGATLSRTYAFWVDRDSSQHMAIQLLREYYPGETAPAAGRATLLTLVSRTNQFVASTDAIAEPVVDRSRYFYYMLIRMAGTDRPLAGSRHAGAFTWGLRAVVIQWHY